MPKAQAARTFEVGATSVKHYVKLAEEGEPLTPGKAPGKKGKLNENAMKLLEEDLYAHPAVIYEKRADLLRELLGVRCCGSHSVTGRPERASTVPRACVVFRSLHRGFRETGHETVRKR